MPDKREIRTSIAKIAKRLGRAPSRAEFFAQSGISPYFVLQYYRSWSDAVRAAGLRAYTLNARAEDRSLLEDWGKAVRRNGAKLPRHIYLLEGRYNPGTLAKRFGGWSSVPEAFRNFAKGKQEWDDVVALLPSRVRVRPGPAPNSKWQPSNNNRASLILPGKPANARLKDRATYGNPMAFAGMRREPVDEQGVVLLFGMVAQGLGFIVEHVQKGFLDCEAMRQISPERWQRVRIEFEFESRNFRDHRHPSAGCDVIVCWRHNWKECPEHIEIVELSTVVKSFAESGKCA